jgi:hypothetical protein
VLDSPWRTASEQNAAAQSYRCVLLPPQVPFL